MKLSDFDFDLPADLIAQYPTKKRTDSKLLIGDKIIDEKFHNIIHYLNKGDLLVLNDTKVIPARILANKQSGGKLEILLERIVDDYHAIAMIKASKAPKINSTITIDKYDATVVEKNDGFYQLRFSEKVLYIANAVGHIPLPPYIKRMDEDTDSLRYQSVFAKNIGAVAAPTASLHFDQNLLNNIQRKGVDSAFVTLHIGAGTFQPVKTANITRHKMHSEYFEISAETIDKIKYTKQHGGRIIAVGTTAVRVLETSNLVVSSGETDIFIYPGFKFSVVDCLLTNFHLPKSSLLMLVSAFIGLEKMHKIYQYAIQHKYRFFSYGDVMFLKLKATTPDFN